MGPGWVDPYAKPHKALAEVHRQSFIYRIERTAYSEVAQVGFQFDKFVPLVTSDNILWNLRFLHAALILVVL